MHVSLIEACRKAVAKELSWKVDQVMDWEVESFMRLRPEKTKAIRAILAKGGQNG